MAFFTNLEQRLAIRCFVIFAITQGVIGENHKKRIEREREREREIATKLGGGITAVYTFQVPMFANCCQMCIAIGMESGRPPQKSTWGIGYTVIRVY